MEDEPESPIPSESSLPTKLRARGATPAAAALHRARSSPPKRTAFSFGSRIATTEDEPGMESPKSSRDTFRRPSTYASQLMEAGANFRSARLKSLTAHLRDPALKPPAVRLPQPSLPLTMSIGKFRAAQVG